MARCKYCGRNYTGKLSARGYCRECALLNYMHDQGAITVDGFEKWKKGWVKKEFK